MQAVRNQQQLSFGIDRILGFIENAVDQDIAEQPVQQGVNEPPIVQHCEGMDFLENWCDSEDLSYVRSRICRRRRTAYNSRQIAALEAAFKKSQFPDFDMRRYLATYLCLDEDRIQVWFRNRRAKHRRTKPPTALGKGVPDSRMPMRGYGAMNNVAPIAAIPYVYPMPYTPWPISNLRLYHQLHHHHY